MTRTRPAVLATAALALAGILAACGGTQSAPRLDDPVAVLEAAATNAAAATSVRIDLAADGEIALDMTGAGAGAPISLEDTTASAEVDIAGRALEASFSLPGVLGLRGELIVVDDAAYVKTSLTGTQYLKTTLADTPVGGAETGGSPDPSAVAEMVAGLREALAKPGVDPVLGPDVQCGNSTCYVVTIQLTPEELAALGADDVDVPLPSALPIPIPMPEIGDQTIDLTITVTTDTNVLAGLKAVIDGGTDGSITADLTFSGWNEDVTISAPPADEIQGG